MVPPETYRPCFHGNKQRVLERWLVGVADCRVTVEGGMKGQVFARGVAALVGSARTAMVVIGTKLARTIVEHIDMLKSRKSYSKS